ncbi:MAG: helix-turn-helix transcriptional regulator [Clostridia bacterium]|nr:helix-turn-helix transcriptional regulator [Clostridia bacterium]
MAEINQRIKNLRTCARKSQQEMAKIFAVSSQLVSKWECSDIVPATEDIIKLSKFFNVSLEYILTGKANDGDMKILNRQLKDNEIKDELKREYKSALKKATDKEIDLLIQYTNLPKSVSVNDNIKELIVFNIKDLIELNNVYIYNILKQSYNVKGKITFELLNQPKVTQYEFFKLAVEEDCKNIQDAFNYYTSAEDVWNSKVILLLINHGAKVMRMGEIREYSTYSIDGCENTKYEVKQVYDLISTKLLKAELEREISI